MNSVEAEASHFWMVQLSIHPVSFNHFLSGLWGAGALLKRSLRRVVPWTACKCIKSSKTMEWVMPCVYFHDWYKSVTVLRWLLLMTLFAHSNQTQHFSDLLSIKIQKSVLNYNWLHFFPNSQITRQQMLRGDVYTQTTHKRYQNLKSTKGIVKFHAENLNTLWVWSLPMMSEEMPECWAKSCIIQFTKFHGGKRRVSKGDTEPHKSRDTVTNS